MSIVLLGSTSGSITLQEPAVAGTNTLSLPAVTGTLVVAGQNSAITAGTAVASTSGTSIDFTSIPSWVKRVTIMLQGVSTNGTSELRIRLGTSGGFVTSGYLGAASTVASGSATTNFTAGFDENASGGSSAAGVRHGSFSIQTLGSNAWTCTGMMGFSNETRTNLIAGSIALGGTLTQVRITTVNGTDTFDAGSINILYE